MAVPVFNFLGEVRTVLPLCFLCFDQHGVKLGSDVLVTNLWSFSHCSFPQVKVSSSVLKAAAHHYGAQCDKPNKEFMLCRWEEKDPRRCLEEGKLVNKCALDFFR